MPYSYCFCCPCCLLLMQTVYSSDFWSVAYPVFTVILLLLALFIEAANFCAVSSVVVAAATPVIEVDSSNISYSARCTDESDTIRNGHRLDFFGTGPW